MHESNVWAAWTLRSHDVLTGALPPGLGLRDVAALTLIASHEGCSADWLWNRIGLTQSGTVRLIDRLEKLGYVARARQGRAIRLSLEPAGTAALATWNERREAAAAEALGGLSDDDRRQLNDLLGRGLRATERARDAADATCRLCDWPACERCPVDESVGQAR
ncbi:transcriptional regulator, MarR family [Kribbella flavida DSM 17836]|uniref:Transcriptional regulator, MarR family n=1 Tax=Kribbella flavida (strain DSM 17836 / JCM 10339 / NBRC 14399) TaxID=479435 RepID=D2PPV9_KRIFD|nr:MarR family winged helix-turn-helix transcriptional regulator [Kribbella flavida]ADB32883.1 transcriptional regulator, MarR family [Kribbella flavida DSM 17836]